MLLTEAHHQWIKDTFGIDPLSFDDPADAQAAPAATAAPTVGDAAGSASPAAPPGPTLPDTNSAEVKALRTTSMRILDPGPAMDARTRMAAALAQMDQAIAAKDPDAAQKALAAAKAESAAVLAGPDPAMNPVKPGEQPNETLYGSTDAEKASKTSDVAVTDIHQQQIGDCYLLSSVGEIAKIDPSIIKKMVKDNKDGTYTVTLHQHKTGAGYYWGKLFGDEFEEVPVTVDGNFAGGTANSQPGDDKVGSQKEIWVQVVEKAYAKLHGGYDKIQGGDPSAAMETLTGKEATTVGTSKVSLDDLKKDIASKKPVVMSTPGDSKKGEMPFKMHANHAYMVKEILTGPDGKVMVQLRNPWGHDDPEPIPFDQLGKVISDVSVGSSL